MLRPLGSFIPVYGATSPQLVLTPHRHNMVPLLENRSLDRRKQVRLKARPNLESKARFQGERKVYVVKDPISLQYYHFEEAQHFALRLMDGRHTLDQIQRTFEAQFKPQRLTLEELESFASQLLQCGLAENDSTSAGRMLHDRFEKQQRWQNWQLLAKIFYFKFPLVEPTRLLDKLAPVGRLLFHPLFALFGALLLFAALGLVITRWSEFLQRLPVFQELFTWQHMLYLWATLGIVKILHEMGHALCTRAVGGVVHELGVVVMFFFPTLYCNVTDTWMLPQKWKRIAIAAAGIYVELFLTAIATFVWWAAEPSTFLSNFCFWVIVVCGTHTLVFNANPLMRFDGYFLLSDWMEVPNLSQAAGRTCLYGALRWLGANIPRESAAGPRVFLYLYGIASYIYRAVVLVCMLYVFFHFMKEQHMEWLGFALVVVALILLATLPAYRFAKMLRQFGKVNDMKRGRVMLVLGLAAAVLAVVFLVPFRSSVHGMGLVQVDASQMQSVVVPTPGGFLEQVYVRDGQRVERGDILAVLRNPKLNLERRLNEADQALRAEQTQALTSQLAVQDAPALGNDSLGEVQQEIRALAQQSATLKTHGDALVLRAPCAGVVMGFPSWENEGKWLEPATQLCHVGPHDQLRLVVLVDPADRQQVKEECGARFHCHGVGASSWSGLVTGVAQVDAQEIPPQLSHRAGGEVITVQDPVNHSEKPRQQYYLVSVKFNDSDSRLQVGALGQVRIDAGSSTLWWRFRNYLGTTFNWGL